MLPLLNTKKDFIGAVSIRRKQMGGDYRLLSDTSFRDIYFTGYAGYFATFAENASDYGFSADVVKSLNTVSDVLLTYSDTDKKRALMGKAYKLAGNACKMMEGEV